MTIQFPTSSSSLTGMQLRKRKAPANPQTAETKVARAAIEHRSVKDFDLSQVKITLIKKKDVRSVVRVHNDAMRAFAKTQDDLDCVNAYANEDLAVNKIMKQVAAGFPKAHNKVFVATFKGKVIGSVGICAWPMSAVAKSIKVDLVTVAQAYQGRGVGSKLLNHVITYCKGKTKTLRLVTYPFLDAACRLYKRHGFEEYNQKLWQGHQLLYFKREL